MALPLEGIRVLDLASMMAGPYGATMLGETMRRLADADVIAAPVLAYPKTVCDPQVAQNRRSSSRDSAAEEGSR